MNFDTIGGILIGALVAAEKDVAIKAMQSIYELDSDLYTGGLYIAKYALKKGATEALKTATSLDDQGVAALQSLITASGANNGIIL